MASWGGFTTFPIKSKFNDTRLTKTELCSINNIFGILRNELGIIASYKRLENSTFAKIFLEKKCNLINCKAPKKEAIFHKIQLTVENLNQTIHFINSLHDLASKIEDLVISEEVSKLAFKAYDNFFLSYNSLINDNIFKFSKYF